MSAPADLTGQKFGKLTALEYLGATKNNGALWLWSCDCGNETEARAKDVKLGTTKSCGCLLTAKRTPKGNCHVAGIHRGDTFGRLTVTRFSHVSDAGFRYYHCRCECGAKTKVRAALLNNGQTRSCG